LSSYLEVWTSGGRQIRPLDSERVTLGTDSTNDIPVESTSVSGVHAVFERFGAAWTVRDLGSRNGTFVNGERIIGERPLRDGDELLLAKLRVVFYGSGAGPRRTEAIDPPPALTPRERDVLIQLCRPLLSGDAFTEPSSIRAIAEALVVSEAAVKQHLSRLYDKFEIEPSDERRRVRLANAAVGRGAVVLGDLRSDP
jgi:FHA domain-containing protein